MADTPEKVKTKRRSSSSTPKHGQLTGFPRRIKDSVADIHNSIQKWENLKNKGFGVVTDIANLKISSRGEDEKSCYPEGLQKLCTDLRSIYNNMENVSNKIYNISRQLGKMANLNSISPTEIFFLTWETSKFAEIAKEISKMYREELSAKKAIVESIAHIDLMSNGNLRDSETSRNILMTYVACWLHEPYINDDTRTILLEEMLLETGHHQ